MVSDFLFWFIIAEHFFFQVPKKTLRTFGENQSCWRPLKWHTRLSFKRAGNIPWSGINGTRVCHPKTAGNFDFRYIARTRASANQKELESLNSGKWSANGKPEQVGIRINSSNGKPCSAGFFQSEWLKFVDISSISVYRTARLSLKRIDSMQLLCFCIYVR